MKNIKNFSLVNSSVGITEKKGSFDYHHPNHKFLFILICFCSYHPTISICHPAIVAGAGENPLNISVLHWIPQQVRDDGFKHGVTGLAVLQAFLKIVGW